MDKTVPAGAARLLDFIRDTEVGTDEPSGYNVIFGFNQGKLPKPITNMTVDEVLASQADWSKRFGSSATGGYQFMRATLRDLKAELKLGGSQVMNSDLQDRLGYHLLRRRGYDEFMAGTLTVVGFGLRLAQEWASFPVLAAVTGAHRALVRGQSYYAGDKLNKALVKPATVEAVLSEVLALGKPGAVVVPAKPEDDEDDTTPPVIAPSVPVTVPVQDTPAGVDGYTIADCLAIIREATAQLERLTK